MPEFKEYDFDARNLPQDILAAIGLVAATSAMAEYTMEQAIGGLSGIDFEYTAAICTHMSNPMRDQALRAVAEIRLDRIDDLDELDTLLDALGAALKKRNDYLHAGWCRDPATGEVFTTKTEARGSVEMSLIPMTVGKIKKDALAIYDTAISVYSFFGARGLLARIPSTPRPRHHKTKAARKKLRKGKV